MDMNNFGLPFSLRARCGVSALALVTLSCATPAIAQRAGGRRATPSSQVAADAPARQNDASSAAQESGASNTQEIVVTATRTASVLSKVPISVAAVTQKQMEVRGLRNFNDIVQQTPGVQLNRSPIGQNDISIRGVSSRAGAATTGVYIDDVPIQVRQVGYSAGTFFPSVFDLDRVEVLRGPQGTLFGSGSEGGTVRFIQPQPDFTRFSGHARAEVGSTQGGAASYEAGVAFGGPIIEDKIAFRISGNFRRDGGYYDRISGDVIAPKDANGDAILDGSAGPAGTTLMNAQRAYKNSNWETATSGRAALSFRPTETLTVTGSINYQRILYHDNFGNVWPSLTNAGKGRFGAPLYVAGSPGTLLNDLNDPNAAGTGQPYLTALTAPTYDRGHDKMVLPYLAIDWKTDTVEVVSSTAWFNRSHDQNSDLTAAYTYSYEGLTAPRRGDKGDDYFIDRQHNFVQEVRIQSSIPDARLHWLVGGFYSNGRQRSIEQIYINSLGLAQGIFGIGANDDPFPGTSALINAFGTPLLANSLSYIANFYARERQLAGFGQVDFKLTPTLTVTTGGRYAVNRLQAVTAQSGPENNLNAPYGSPCTDAGGCTPGQGSWVPLYAGGSLNSVDKVFTPKISVSWKPDDTKMFYGTVAKGFRPGGAQVRLPAACDDDLAKLGYVDGNGDAYTPTSYKPDTVWSYEVGAKTRLFGGKVFFDGNAYIIKWDKIQSRLSLPVCGYAFTDNLGKATSRGFDASINFNLVPRLSITTSVSYNHTTFDVATPAFSKGDFVPDTGSPWTVFGVAEYTMPFASGREMYANLNATYRSKRHRTGALNPDSPIFIPQNVAPPSSLFVNARLGMRIADLDVSVFANNLFNYNRSQGLTYQSHSSIFTTSYFRPRTLGITASYHY